MSQQPGAQQQEPRPHGTRRQKTLFVPHSSRRARPWSPVSVAQHGAVRDDDRGVTRCSCSATSLFSPSGEIVVLRVAGEIDLATIDLPRAALDAFLDQRPDHLVVDLTGLGFCSSGGLRVLVDAGLTAARHGISYALAAPSAQAERLWATLWPTGEVPQQYPSTSAAVLGAMAQPARRRTRAQVAPARASRATRPATPADEAVSIEERRFAARAGAGDRLAYEPPVGRHRDSIYGDALHALDASGRNQPSPAPAPPRMSSPSSTRS